MPRRKKRRQPENLQSAILVHQVLGIKVSQWMTGGDADTAGGCRGGLIGITEPAR
jgi:hypothetical protein